MWRVDGCRCPWWVLQVVPAGAASTHQQPGSLCHIAVHHLSRSLFWPTNRARHPSPLRPSPPLHLPSPWPSPRAAVPLPTPKLSVRIALAPTRHHSFLDDLAELNTRTGEVRSVTCIGAKPEPRAYHSFVASGGGEGCKRHLPCTAGLLEACSRCTGEDVGPPHLPFWVSVPSCSAPILLLCAPGARCYSVGGRTNNSKLIKDKEVRVGRGWVAGVRARRW